MTDGGDAASREDGEANQNLPPTRATAQPADAPAEYPSTCVRFRPIGVGRYLRAGEREVGRPAVPPLSGTAVARCTSGGPREAHLLWVGPPGMGYMLAEWGEAAAHRARGVLLAACVLMLTPPAAAEPSRSVGFVGWASSPVVMRTVPARGIGLRGWSRIGESALGLELEADLGAADGYAGSLRVMQQHALVTVGLGAGMQLGAGRLTATVRAGGRFIRELTEQQFSRRLAAAGLSSSSRSGWSAGPVAAAAGGMAVRFHEGWELAVSGGPLVGAVVQADEGTSWLWGWSTSVGVCYGW